MNLVDRVAQTVRRRPKPAARPAIRTAWKATVWLTNQTAELPVGPVLPGTMLPKPAKKSPQLPEREKTPAAVTEPF